MYKRKGSTFFFQGPRSAEKTLEKVAPFKFSSQVIVCGSLAKKFMAAFEEKTIFHEQMQENTRYPAFIYTHSGTINYQLNVQLEAHVVYKNKRTQNISYERKDNFSNHSDSSQSSHEHYAHAKANFDSKLNTWVVFAVKNDAEREKIMAELRPCLAHQRFKAYIYNYAKSSTVQDHPFLQVSEQFIASSLELKTKEIIEKLRQDADEFITALNKAEILKLQEAAQDDIERNLHQDAEQYFAEQRNKGCVIT